METIYREMPYGYRWATREDMKWVEDHPDWFVEVENGNPIPGLAIQWDCVIEFGMDHDHDPEECERIMADMNSPFIENDNSDIEYQSYMYGSSRY